MHTDNLHSHVVPTEEAAYQMCNLFIMSLLLWFLGRFPPGISVGSFVLLSLKSVLVILADVWQFAWLDIFVYNKTKR